MGTMERQATVLPLSLPPRGLRRTQAAAYIGVSPTKFDEMVLQGTMPQPKEIGTRRLWDRQAIDEAFEALPDKGEDNPWNV